MRWPLAKMDSSTTVDAVQPGASNEPPGDNAGDGNALVRFDFEEKEATSLLSGVNDFAMSANGSHLLLARTDGSLAVAELADDLEPEALKACRSARAHRSSRRVAADF